MSYSSDPQVSPSQKASLPGSSAEDSASIVNTSQPASSYRPFSRRPSHLLRLWLRLTPRDHRDCLPTMCTASKPGLTATERNGKSGSTSSFVHECTNWWLVRRHYRHYIASHPIRVRVGCVDNVYFFSLFIRFVTLDLSVVEGLAVSPHRLTPQDYFFPNRFSSLSRGPTLHGLPERSKPSTSAACILTN